MAEDNQKMGLYDENPPRQKLYTEEQVRKAIELARVNNFGSDFEKWLLNSEDIIMNDITPIELPSDDETKIKLILSARFVDFKIRKDGKEYVFEGDFIKDIIYKSEYYKQILNQNK